VNDLFVFGHGGLSLAGHQMPTKGALILPLLSWTGERKYNERLMSQDKDRERSLTCYHHRQNRLDLEINLTYC